MSLNLNNNISKIKLEELILFKKSIDEQKVKCLEIKNKIMNKIDEISKITLSKAINTTSEDFIDMIIFEEKINKKHGWQKRIENLIDLKNKNQIIKKIYENNQK